MNISTTQIENYKNFKNELHIVEKIQSWNKLEVKLIGYEDIRAKITKTGKKLNLETTGRLNQKDFEIDQFSFIVENVIYETERIEHSSTNTQISVDFPASFSVNYDIKTFQTKGFNQNGLFRTFYPVDLNNINTFHYEFETVTYQSKTHEHFYDCLRVTINGIEYDIVQIKTESQGFYVFECLKEETFENYLQICFSIKQAIGFINNLMVGGEEYIFDNSGHTYYSNHIRPTMKGMYRPLSSNPYSFMEIKSSIAHEFVGKLTRISLENLSNLIFKIHTNADFSTAILGILEVSSIRSLLLMPSAFAVIIELLSKAIGINETGLEVPIDDKELKKKIIEELHKVIDNNSDSLTEETILKLKRRLNEINSPINKQRLTNNEKLTRPFEQLGIQLTLHDIKIIEHRNDLLHGDILLRKDESQSDESINLYMSYVSAKLYTLISKLILKSIGYHGYIYNNAKHLEMHLNNSTEENYFEII